MAGALLLAACGGGGTTGGKTDTKAGGAASPAAGKAAATVGMTADFKFDPANVTIQRGQTVTWRNTDTQVHNVKFNTGQSSPDVMNAGQDWSRAFPDTGTFDYVCSLHTAQGMTGKVTVQ